MRRWIDSIFKECTGLMMIISLKERMERKKNNRKEKNIEGNKCEHHQKDIHECVVRFISEKFLLFLVSSSPPPKSACISCRQPSLFSALHLLLHFRLLSIPLEQNTF